MWPFSKRLPAEVRRPIVRRRLIRSITSSLTSRLTGNWTTTPQTADQYIYDSLQRLRARSRDRAINDGYARRYLKLVQRNVVGPMGLTLQAQPLRANGDLDFPAAQAIERAWRDWSRPENCSINKRLSLIDLQALAMTTVVKDGETLIRTWTGQNLNRYGFALQLLDAERLPVDYNETLSGGNVVRFGIEYSESGMIVAYHLVVPNMRVTGAQLQQGYYTSGSRTLQRVPADQIIHLFYPEIVEQRRGLPWMTTAMERMKILSQYERAALVAAQEGANKVGFIIGAGENSMATHVDEDGNPYASSEEGEWKDLPADAEVQTYDPTYPSSDFDPFTKRVGRGMASALDCDYNMLANDAEGINLSTIRHFAADQREEWKTQQNWLAMHLMDRIYRPWLSLSLLAGNITIGNTSLDVNSEAKYQNVRWQGKRWQFVEPQKEADANAKSNDYNAKSVSDWCRDQGRDPDEVFLEIQRERETWQRLGIAPGAAMTEAQNA